MNKGSYHKASINERQDPGTNSSGASGTRRIIFLDQIKAIMIALVIATHTVLVGTLFTTDLKQTIEAAPAYEAISFWFGWISIPFVIFSSSIVALISVLPSLINKSKKFSSEIPFGPFIIIGCILYIIFMEQYKNLLFG